MENKLNYFTHKEHRLAPELYTGIVRVSFTLCIKERRYIFTSPSIVDTCIDALRESLNTYDCKNWVYIFMPDHVHLVLEGRSEKANVLKAITLFKQKTGYWFSHNAPAIKWQKSSYDHIHRKEDDLVKHVRYILDNPVRKGLCHEWKEYPYKGSLDWDIGTV